MMREPIDQALLLLRKASEDIVAGEDVAAAGHVVGAICFHAQQAAEKSLKALLALEDVMYPYTHDLGQLLRLVEPVFGAVGADREEIIALSEYAVEVRYEDRVGLDADEARRALDTARRVHAFAEAVIGGRARSQRPDEEAGPAAEATRPAPKEQHET